MPARKRSVPTKESGESLLAAVENFLKKNSVLDEFNRLVSFGSDGTFLASLLLSFAEVRGWDTWEQLSGFPRRRLPTVLERLETCATDVERLNGSWLAQLILRSPKVTSSVVEHLLALPELLRAYADLTRTMAGETRLQPKSHPHLDNARALLVSHVIQKTGQPRDNEVARLLSVILDRPDLTADSQKDWRGQHADLLNSVAKLMHSA